MNRLTPPPSFRSARPTFHDSQRLHPLSLNPSPLRTTRTESRSNTMYIITDPDFNNDLDYLDPSYPDEDMIFPMSPVDSHEFASSPSSLSPLLYYFPSPPQTHKRTKHFQDRSRNHVSYSPSRNARPPTLSRPVYADPSSSLCGLDASAPRPLTASLLDTPFLSPCRPAPKMFSPSTPARHASSPIPIPGKKSRYSSSEPISCPPPRPNCPCSLDRGVAQPATENIAYPYHPHSVPHCRIEGFGDGPESDADADESVTDSHSPATPSTMYSSAGSGPFRLAKFLDDTPY